MIHDRLAVRLSGYVSHGFYPTRISVKNDRAPAASGRNLCTLGVPDARVSHGSYATALGRGLPSMGYGMASCVGQGMRGARGRRLSCVQCCGRCSYGCGVRTVGRRRAGGKRSPEWAGCLIRMETVGRSGGRRRAVPDPGHSSHPARGSVIRTAKYDGATCYGRNSARRHD